jgi:mono/diheme cytochrome c family protein
VFVRLLIGCAVTIAITTALVTLSACGRDASESAGDRGARPYAANCAVCHGDALQGTSRGPSLLDPAYLSSELSDAAVRSAIRDGVEQNRWEFGAMPANGALRDAQINEIIAFVRAGQSDLDAGG